MLKIKNVSKSFSQAETAIRVLSDLNLEISIGGSLAILGASGSGKTTLLALAAGLDRPDQGNIFILEKDITQFDEPQMTQFRAENIGIIFQQFHLLPQLNALENVSLPLEILDKPQATHLAQEALKKVGLSHRLNHYPHQLSGGENQRVAIARAFVVKPKLLLADEPSGSLDGETGTQVMDLLFNLVDTEKTTLLLVTHDENLARRCQTIMRLNRC